MKTSFNERSNLTWQRYTRTILGELYVAQIDIFVAEKGQESATALSRIRYVFPDEDDENPPPRVQVGRGLDGA